MTSHHLVCVCSEIGVYSRHAIGHRGKYNNILLLGVNLTFETFFGLVLELMHCTCKSYRKQKI